MPGLQGRVLVYSCVIDGNIQPLRHEPPHVFPKEYDSLGDSSQLKHARREDTYIKPHDRENRGSTSRKAEHSHRKAIHLQFGL